MSTVVASFTTKPQDFPAGTTGSYLFVLTDMNTGAFFQGTGKQGDTSISIADVPAGTYTGSITLVDANGVALIPLVGDPTPLVIETPVTVTLQVPAALTLVAS